MKQIKFENDIACVLKRVCNWGGEELYEAAQTSCPQNCSNVFKHAVCSRKLLAQGHLIQERK